MYRSKIHFSSIKKINIMISNTDSYTKFCLTSYFSNIIAIEMIRKTPMLLSIQKHQHSSTKNVIINSEQDGLLMLFILSKEQSIIQQHLGIVTKESYEFESIESLSLFTIISILIPFSSEEIISWQNHFDINLSKLNPINKIEDIQHQALVTTPEIFGIIHKINSCNKKGVFQKYYLENKIEELLLLQLEAISKQQNTAQQITHEDFVKIKLAQKIILENLQSKITIPQLAKRVGTNECKLKKHFKLIFENTILGYSTEYKMQKAKCKMQNEEVSIKELADELGYKTQNHFSTVFKRFYGFAPSELLKNKSALLYLFFNTLFNFNVEHCIL